MVWMILCTKMLLQLQSDIKNLFNIWQRKNNQSNETKHEVYKIDTVEWGNRWLIVIYHGNSSIGIKMQERDIWHTSIFSFQCNTINIYQFINISNFPPISNTTILLQTFTIQGMQGKKQHLLMLRLGYEIPGSFSKHQRVNSSGALWGERKREAGH